MRAVSAAVHAGLLVTIAACAGNPGPSATTPQSAATPAPVPATAMIPAPGAIDLTGDWVGTINFQGQTMGVDITLTRATNGTYAGQAAPQGSATPAQLSSLRLDGNHIVMVFVAPDGEANFDVMLTGDRQAFTGNISYQGQQIPITARKRP
jgi:hypothetical protein